MITAHMHKHKHSKRYNRPIGVKESSKLNGRYANIMNCCISVTRDAFAVIVRMRNV